MKRDESSGMDIDIDPAFQESFWRIERWAWSFYGLLLVAALVGLTGGSGLFAHTTATGRTASVTYPRIARWLKPDRIYVDFTPSTASTATVEVDAALAERFAITTIQPLPFATQSTARGLRFVFAAVPGQSLGRVTFFVTPTAPALALRLGVRLNDHERLVLASTILP